MNEVNLNYPVLNDLGDIYKPTVEEVKHLDMYSHDPVFR
jgi:hypothetical protein